MVVPTQGKSNEQVREHATLPSPLIARYRTQCKRAGVFDVRASRACDSQHSHLTKAEADDRDASILSRREASAPPPLRPLHLNIAESSSKSGLTASGGVSETCGNTARPNKELSGSVNGLCCFDLRSLGSTETAARHAENVAVW